MLHPSPNYLLLSFPCHLSTITDQSPDAELLETAQFSIDMEHVRPLITLTKLRKAKRRKTREGKQTADSLYMVNFQLKITVNELGLSYHIECADSRKKAKTGTLALPYIVDPGTVLRNSSGDVLGTDGG